VPLAAGCVQLGSAEGDAERRYNERQHQVCVQAFALGKYEVTLGEFRQFATTTGHQVPSGCWAWNGTQWDNNPLYRWDSPGFTQTEEQPVVCVSWDDTQAYLAWLNRTTGQQYRLATEAEWEYAARAQTQTARPWGDAPEAACEYANGADRSSLQTFNWSPIHECSDGQIYTAPIGSYRANAWGLHDMLGNAAEWTCSEYDRNYGDTWALHCATAKTIETDPRVIRGGAWANVPDWVRSAQRVGKPPATRFNYVGFRLARGS
jgi:formylglycine-generating enzyme required for sulfatase activity